MASSLDQIGPLANSVEDVAIVFSRIVGEDAHDATTAPSGKGKLFEDYLTEEVKGITVGIPKEYFSEDLDPAIRKVCEEAILRFKALGMEVKEISLPHSAAALPVYYIVMPCEVSSNLARFDGIKYGLSVNDQKETAPGINPLLETYLDSRRFGFGKEVKKRIMLGTHALSSGYYDAYYLKAQKVRALIKKDFEEAFRDLLWLASQASHLAQQGLLLGTQVLRHHHLDDDILVTAAPTSHVGHASPGHPERLSVLGAGGDRNLDRTVQGRYLDAVSKRRLHHIDAQVVDDLLVASGEVQVRLHPQHDIQIAGRAAPDSCLALAADADL
jgi:hypothetical protein